MASVRLAPILLLLASLSHAADTVRAEPLAVQKGDRVVSKKVLTPGGYRPESQVHKIAPGHVLDSSGGRLRELDAEGNVVADFGPAPGGRARKGQACPHTRRPKGHKKDR